MAVTGAGWGVALIAMIVAALGQHSLPLIVVGIAFCVTSLARWRVGGRDALGEWNR
jgi:hypothetical protein